MKYVQQWLNAFFTPRKQNKWIFNTNVNTACVDMEQSKSFTVIFTKKGKKYF